MRRVGWIVSLASLFFSSEASFATKGSPLPHELDTPSQVEIEGTWTTSGESRFDVDAGRWLQRRTRQTMRMKGREGGKPIDSTNVSETRWWLVRVSGGPGTATPAKP